nr:MAG TPA: hypothetical protein [Caudoviricetes sp.]
MRSSRVETSIFNESSSQFHIVHLYLLSSQFILLANPTYFCKPRYFHSLNSLFYIF